MEETLKKLLNALEELDARALLTVGGKDVLSARVEDKTIKVEIKDAKPLGRIVKRLK